MLSERYTSAPTDPSPLGEPLHFPTSGRVAKNRFFKAAMSEDLASWSAADLEQRGIPTKESIELYRRWGEGGWGTILTGTVDIEFDVILAVGNAMITPECPPSGPRFEAFRAVADAAKAHGSLLIAQVGHPGRQLSSRLGKDTIAPSALPLGPSKLGMTYANPREATTADIERVVTGFAHTASYLEAAGFSGVELHAAHGYLLSQFLSPSSNVRTDRYGGSLQNRIRIIAEISHAIRACTGPDFVLGIKINSVEFQDKGLTPSEAAELCSTLEGELGFDFIELSGGNHENLGYGGEKESTRKREAYFLEFVKDIAPRLSKAKKVLTGGFRTVGAMVEALEMLDGIGIGRPAAQEPRLPNDILAGRVLGSIKPPDEFARDVMLNLMAATTQMTQIAKGLEPFDLSDNKAADIFKAELQQYIAEMIADGDKLEFRGALDLASTEVALKPYGETY